ncbi:hypothetical protein H9W90_11495 [Polaribacter pectinis]|uniref:Uncharacterized protein n=2 Tax=Polaribacter pectinis TaxID=2738844 RepID=A0A7G9LER1_9FLAO|nr:hypothetical protein H9W90_11495 [Polaribacter pectinis]
MTFIATTYRTFSGTKEILEIPKKKETQWIVYQDNEPKFFVDFYDLEKEANAMMNSLVLCTKRSMSEVLELINKKNNINLSVPKISRLGLSMKLKSEVRHLELETIPEKWLSYSL